MSKLKQAIAQLMFDIRCAIEFLRAIFQEQTHGLDRAESRNLSQGIPASDRESASRGIAQGSQNIAGTIRVQKEDPCIVTPASEILGFWAGDLRDILLGPDDSRSASAEPVGRAGLQDEAKTRQYSEPDCDWDLLGSRDRQAIILAAMWQSQAESEYHELFSVRDVIHLCGDRADMHWDLTYEDLIELRKQSKVEVFDVSTVNRFYGFYWGLK